VDSLSAHDIFRIWDLGEQRHPVDRTLMLLAAACRDMTWDELARLSIGQRDRLLLALREATFGQRLDSYCECPECRERLEFALSTADLRPPAVEEKVHDVKSLCIDGIEIQYRMPDSRDLAAAACCDDVADARDVLIRRCVAGARREETALGAETLPDSVVAALGNSMTQEEALSEVQVNLCCPECGHRWPVILDIASFLWTEIGAYARRLLREVHTLARAYGWREADILAMSARRRRLYIEQVT
jgi:rubredoxin